MARIVRVSQVQHKSLDDQLAGHLEKAEHHLIEAAKLFETEPKLRSAQYVQRLHRAQETTTSLFGEELVRIRDSKKRVKKK